MIHDLCCSVERSLHHIPRPHGGVDGLHTAVPRVPRHQGGCGRGEAVPAVVQRRCGCAGGAGGDTDHGGGQEAAGQCQPPRSGHGGSVRQAAGPGAGADVAAAAVRDQLHPGLQHHHHEGSYVRVQGSANRQCDLPGRLYCIVWYCTVLHYRVRAPPWAPAPARCCWGRCRCWAPSPPPSV